MITYVYEVSWSRVMGLLQHAPGRMDVRLYEFPAFTLLRPGSKVKFVRESPILIYSFHASQIKQNQQAMQQYQTPQL